MSKAPTDGENYWNSATNKCKSTYSIGLDQLVEIVIIMSIINVFKVFAAGVIIILQ